MTIISMQAYWNYTRQYIAIYIKAQSVIIGSNAGAVLANVQININLYLDIFFISYF